LSKFWEGTRNIWSAVTGKEALGPFLMMKASFLTASFQRHSLICFLSIYILGTLSKFSFSTRLCTEKGPGPPGTEWEGIRGGKVRRKGGEREGKKGGREGGWKKTSES
jgi:hypothetical protein